MSFRGISRKAEPNWDCPLEHHMYFLPGELMVKNFLDGSSQEPRAQGSQKRYSQGAQKGVSSLTMEFPECHFRCVL